MTRGHKPGNGPKRNTSRRLRQLRTLGLLLAVGALAFFWQPLQQRLQGPAALRTVAAPEQALPLQALPADAAAVAVRKGLVYTLATDRLRAIRPDGSVQWEKTLPEPGVQLYPSFDGVLVRTGEAIFCGTTLWARRPAGSLFPANSPVCRKASAGCSLKTGKAAGTPGPMSPERFSGPRKSPDPIS